jgi:crossover junction endodeoxyribonuclease RusA
VEAVTLRLPWPPSVNHYWRSIPVGRRCRVVISRDGRAYRRAVNVAFAAARPSGWTGPLEGRLSARVNLHPPTRRAIDIDNRMKALLDAMEHAGVYRDDSQIDHLEIVRADVTKTGAATVEITEVAACS